MKTASQQNTPLQPQTKQFVQTNKKLFINGEFIESQSGKTFPVFNPATAETICQVAHGDKQDIDRAVASAREAFDHGPWRKLTPSERGKMLWKLADLIEKHQEEFAELETLDNGKPLAVSKAGDVPFSIDYFRYFAGWATKIEGNTIPISASGAEFHSYTLPEPVGVVGQITPWNFPLCMATWKLAPALACGCCVVLKPAEQTPLTALRLAELVNEAGFPKGVINIVTGYGEAGAALSAHPQVDKIAFTGSTEVGKMIVQAATGNLKKVSLELGGKSPNIVFRDSALDQAIPGSAQAIFLNHGQNCCAGSRLFIEKGIYDKVVEGVAEAANGIKLGNGFEPDTEMGPLISQEQMERVMHYIESGKSEGAQAVCGGEKHGSSGYFVKPTVMVNTKPAMKIVKEEIFGPVVTAIPFSDTDEIAKFANDTPYGLAAGIWTNDLSKAHTLARKIRAGTVWINCYNVVDPALPFGGFKESGWGREMGHEALRLYTETKSVCIQLS